MRIVIDTETGQVGDLEERPGYVMGGAYVNPSKDVHWLGVYVDRESIAGYVFGGNDGEG